MFQTLTEIMLLENCLSMKIRNYNTESQGWVNMTLKSTKVEMSWEFVISWVLSHHNKNLKQGTSSWMDQYCSSVLQLSFI